MPYQAEQDVTIPKVIGTRMGPGDKRIELKESINYSTGVIVLEKDIDPAVLSRLEAGDDHLSTLLRYVDPAEARAIMAEQVAAFESQSTNGEEVLHNEERLAGDGPTADPSVVVETGPGYEEPAVEENAETPAEGTHVETADQTTGQGTEQDQEAQETVEEAQTTDQEVETTEENADGASESEGEADTEVADEVEASTETQSSEQANTSDDQESEVQGDKYDAMDFAALKAEAKERGIKGRSTMKEDQLREALRA